MYQIKDLINEFSKRPEVESIALGGSRAAKTNDANSDYDLYFYMKEDLSCEIRKEILQKYCTYMEVNNSYWEVEDDCILKSGIIIEIIYRSIEDLESMLHRVVIEGNANNGYSTCMWDNLLQCEILYDSNHRLQELKEKYQIPYPELLQENIIKKNLELLDGYIPSYSKQIEKALERNDIISINHRITEFLASYFDIIWALNRKTHPGEKRLIQLCKDRCEILPKDFEQNLNILLSSNQNKHMIMKAVNDIVLNLKDVL